MPLFRIMFRQESWTWLLALLVAICLSFQDRAWGRTDEKAAVQEDNRNSSSHDDRTHAAMAAASAVAVNQPLTAWALLQAGAGFSLWSGLPEKLEPETAKAPPLLNLDSVQDGTKLLPGEESLAFCEALVKAHQTSQRAFSNSATRSLTYGNLFNEPQLHRGKVVHLEGRLKRLIRYEPPSETKTDKIKDRYDAWIFDPDNYGANPFYVVFTDLPAGLEPGDKLDVRVSFDGYFFKKYRYQAADVLRDAPLLIGHTIILKQAPVKSDSEEGGLFSGIMAVTFLGVLGGVFLLAFLLTLWYRRNDRAVQMRLINAQASTFQLPPDEGETAAIQDKDIPPDI
jgi:hypothetical protein